MHKVSSADGTAIAFDKTGEGPPVILVMGAFNTRAAGAPLAAFLAPHFTVFCHDRRGRGDSSDASRYTVEREIEDLAAVLRVAGGSASVFGYSSGAVLALKAAASGVAITKLALYEAPPPQSADHVGELASLIAAGRRGDAVEYFQIRVVGIPLHIVAQLRNAPFRPGLEAMAHTLVYEATIMGDAFLAPELVAKVPPPTLAIAGGASPPSMREVADTLARLLPNGRSHILDDATHDIVPAVVGPVLEDFLGGANR